MEVTDEIPWEFVRENMEQGTADAPVCGICSQPALGKGLYDDEDDCWCEDVICDKCDTEYEYDEDADAYKPRKLLSEVTITQENGAYFAVYRNEKKEMDSTGHEDYRGREFYTEFRYPFGYQGNSKWFIGCFVYENKFSWIQSIIEREGMETLYDFIKFGDNVKIRFID
jgi:hypothetical protein